MMLGDNCKHKKVSLKFVVTCFWENCENQLSKFLLSLVVSLVFFLIKHLLPLNTCGFDISNIFVTIFSNLLGFAIAGYAIILSFGKDIVCILLEPFEISDDSNSSRENKDPMNPFQILSATFTYCCLILLITNIIILFFNHNFFYLLILYFFCSYSIILVGDLIFHLYSTSFYIKDYKDRCKDKNEDNMNNNSNK